MPKGVLSKLVIDEIAFCERGMNPAADILLYKRRPDEGEWAEFDASIDASVEAAQVAVEKFAGSPRSKYGTHSSKGFKGSYSKAWRTHFSQIGGGAITGGAGGPIRGTVRRVSMIAAGMKPPCSLPDTESIGARSGGDSPLAGTFPSKPSDYGLSSWAKPSDDDLTQEDVRLTCSDLAVIKRAALAEVKWRAKKREEREKKKFRKEEGDFEPGTFAEYLEEERVAEIGLAIERRLRALISTTSDILHAGDVDREALILEAVNDYAAAMNRDVPELFAGRLAKAITSWEAEDEPPEDRAIADWVIRELEAAGLAGDVKKGEKMDWLKNITKEERAALDYVLAGTDPAEFFKGTSEEAGAFVAKLVARAVEATTADTGLATANAELTKLRAESGTDEGLEALLKSITDPNARSLIEMQRKKIAKQDETMAALTKASRRAELTAIVKSLDCLPNEKDALLVALEKADGAGILETLEAVLKSANAQAKVGKQLQEIGGDTITGEGGIAADPVAADEALMAKAIELKKAFPTLTDEQRYAKACDENPTLYAQTRTPARPLQ